MTSEAQTEAEEFLSTAFPPTSTPGFLDFDKVLENVLMRWKPDDLIRSVLAQKERVEAVAARSYFHKNGFDKITLVTNPRFKLRLHIWWPERTISYREHVHSHRWTFATKMLVGEYLLELFLPSESGASYYTYRYLSPEETDDFVLSEVGTTRLEESYRMHILKGLGYTLSASGLHRVSRSADGPIVTMMLRGPATRGHGDVYSESQIETKPGGRAKRFATDELTERLHRVLGLLT